MGAFTMGEPFKNIQEYCDYPYSKLYHHGHLIGKAVTDNWQFRLIRNGIVNGWLCKAKLNEGYSLYKVTAICFYDYESKPSYTHNSFIIAKNEKEAEKKMIRNSFLFKGCIPTDIDHEYTYPHERTIIKVKAEICDDR